MRGCRALLISITPLIAFPALAGEGPYLGLEGHAVFADDLKFQQNGNDVGKLAFDPGYLGGITVGGTFHFGLRPELELNFRSNEAKSFIDLSATSSPSRARVDAYGALVNVWYELRSDDGPLEFVHPYFGGGVGGLRVQFRDAEFAGPATQDDGRSLLAYQGGAGIGFDATDFVTVSLDYRYLQTARGAFLLDPNQPRFSTRYHAQSVGASVRFSFAGSEYRHVKVVTREQAPAMPPPRAYAAPIDSDGDGVPDDIDQCAGTPPGFKVDLKGCIIQQSVILQAVEFDTASDRLTPASRVTLDKIAAALRAQPTLKVEVGGYTDSQGSALSNLRLSERRATAVLKYLVSQGVNRANLSAKGYGQARPIADNTTEEGRAQNRRVEFKVLLAPPTVKVIEKKKP